MTKPAQRIIIIGNGEDWQKEKILSFCQTADFIIAADNGLSLLHQFDITPDLIIGDLDSVSPALLQRYPDIPVEKFPGKKDFSDTELAIKKVITLNPREIILLAVTGNYFDHSYAAIINLFRNYKSGIEIKIVTSNSLIFPIKKKTTLLYLKGRRFSLFPISDIKNFSMQGAQYQFAKKNLKVTDYSLSNVIVQEKLEINLEKGMLFCVLFDEDWK
jgi:thiamine pyrophosphokinase